VAGCCEYGDEPSGSGTTELVSTENILSTKPVFKPSSPEVSFPVGTRGAVIFKFVSVTMVTVRGPFLSWLL
jgi:hypothetical protein